jgi:hypothetical protein
MCEPVRQRHGDALVAIFTALNMLGSETKKHTSARGSSAPVCKFVIAFNVEQQWSLAHSIPIKGYFDDNKCELTAKHASKLTS